MEKQPKLMNISRMRDILEPHLQQIRKSLYIDRNLMVARGGDPTLFRLIVQQRPPFTINDYRLGVIVRGEMKVNINLVDKQLSAGMLVFIGPGTIINPVSFSHDLEFYGIVLSANFSMPFAPGQMPVAFNGQMRDFQLSASEADIAIARHIIDTLWHIVHQPNYNTQTVSSLIAAQMHHYNSLYCLHTDSLQAMQSREQTIFDRFIYLVNQHSQREHQLGFYAEKMCLTQRYLGTVIRQASGTTAKDWIDRAIITRAMAELRHSDKSVAHIAEEMHFSNPAFFCKYFKRLTGHTPLEYKHKSSIP